MGEKLKILWFSNATFSDKEPNATGTWLHSMADTLVKKNEIQLFNITLGSVKEVTPQNSGLITQWIFPYQPYKLPNSKTINEIKGIVDDVCPDVIHVWGLESFWGLLTAREYIKGNIILEIQGLQFVIEKYFYSGLSFKDIIKCLGLKELLRPFGSLPGMKYRFRRRGNIEKEMLMNHCNISTQSDWIRAYIKEANPLAKIYKTSISLRKEFVNAKKWELEKCVPFQVFTSTSSIVSYKGLHILVDAIAILKKQYPQVKLVIAGSVSNGIRQDGYTKWLKNKIKLLAINENVSWLGALDAENIVLQMRQANVVVVPSFVESYCLALDEALTLGVPTVASFAGAMPELATFEKSALYFPPGDFVMCANAIGRFFDDKSYVSKISENAYNLKKSKSQINIADVQISIYNNVLQNNKIV